MASKIITKKTFDAEGFCDDGYKLLYSESSLTGELGFMWTVVCE